MDLHLLAILSLLSLASNTLGKLFDENVQAIQISLDPLTYLEEELTIDTYVTLRGNTSEPIREITEIGIRDLGGTATGDVDYMSFNETITLYPGNTTFEYRVLIMADILDEDDEMFEAMITLESEGDVIINDQADTANITIQDLNRVFFDPVLYTAVEEQIIQILTIGSERPVSSDSMLRVYNRDIFVRSAIGGVDYFSFSTTLLLAQGQDRVEFAVTLIDDDLFEEPELFEVLLDIVSGNELGILANNGVAVVLILDNDMTTIGFSPITYQEREEVGFVTWRIVASSPVPSDTVLRIDEVLGGTATSGVDYDSFNNTQVTLPAGETVVELNVTFVDDSFLESNETFSGILSIVSGNSNVDSDTDTATVTILDEADTISVSFDMELYAVTEGSANFISYLVINIAGQTEIDLVSSVVITFTDGSATSLLDYNALSGPYSIYVGNSTVRIPFTILSDTLDEAVESFNTQLSIDDSFINRIVLDAIQNTRVDISDDDSVEFDIDIQFRDISVSENNGTVTVCVRRSGDTTQVYSVTLEAKENTIGLIADDPDDFIGEIQTFDFPANVAIVCRSFQIEDNIALEGDEGFNVMITAVSLGATIGEATSDITILDDDTIQISLDPLTYLEEELTIDTYVTLRGNTSEPIRGITEIRIRDLGGTATGGVDYMSFNDEIITLYPGNTTFEYRVLIMADILDENDEMFQAVITLENGGGVIINDQADTANITIQDLNRVSFNTVLYTPVEEQIIQILTIRSERPVSSDSILRVYNRDMFVLNRAISGVDYFSFSTPLLLAQGQDTVESAVTLIDDDLIEEPELFEVVLDIVSGNGLGILASSGVAGVLILDDIDMTTIGFSPITYREKEEVGFFTWRIVASSPVPSDTVLQIDEMIGGTATSGVDYDSFNNTQVTLPAGETVVELNVTFVDDSFLESNETFSGILSIVSGNSRVTVDSDTDTATVTILDEADTISVSFDMELYAVTEGSADFISYLVINIAGQTEIDLVSSVVITFTDGSATSLLDYNALSGPYSIYVGNSTVRIPFTILSDTLDEAVESFNTQLSIDDSFINRIVLGAIQNTRVDIPDDDSVEFDIDIQFRDISVSVNNGTVTVCVRRSGDTTQVYSVTLEAKENTIGLIADDPDDFIGEIQTFDFPANVAIVCRSFQIEDNIALEGDEGFNVMITAVSLGATIGEATSDITILDDDTIQISLDPLTYLEDELTINTYVTLRGNTSEPIREITEIGIRDLGGTATGGIDYMSFNETITLYPGNTTFEYRVLIMADILDEDDEMFQAMITLENVGDVIINDQADTANITIQDLNRVFFDPVLYTPVEEQIIQILTIGSERPVSSDSILRVYNRDIFVLSAISGVDYFSFSTTLLLAQGQDRVEFAVTLIDDDLIEEPELFEVLLDIVSGNELGILANNGVAVVLILDNDMTTIGFSPITYQEKEEVGFVTWRIVASSPVLSDTVLRIDEVIGGTATSGVDYDSFNNTQVTLPAGETVVELNVTFVDDSFLESNETFCGILSIVSGNSNLTVDSDTDTATVTILDETDTISVSFDRELYAVTEGSADFISYLAINITGQTEIDLLSSLIITFTDESATSLLDYNALSGPYPIYVGNSTVRIPFTILSDTLDEAVESFNTQLSINDSFINRIVLGAIQNTRVDISDDDGVQFDIDIQSRDISVSENNGTITVCVRRSGDTTQVYSVTLEAKENTIGLIADDPDDFIGEIQTFDFPVIIPIVCRLFQIENDSIALEGDEGFNVMITAVSLEATIGETTSDITILDDDTPTLTPAINSDTGTINYIINENAGVVTVCLMKDLVTAVDFTVTFRAQEKTPPDALSPKDFIAEEKQVTFLANANLTCTTFTIINDLIDEVDESFEISFTAPAGVIPPSMNTMITIIDDESSSVSFTKKIYHGKEGREVEVCLMLSNQLDMETSVNLIISNSVIGYGDAENDDYSGVLTVVTFVPPSQMSCFNIKFPGDTEDEFQEAIKLTIDTSGSGLNPGNITEADVVITDDDILLEPSSTPESKQSSNLLLFISISIVGVILL